MRIRLRVHVGMWRWSAPSCACGVQLLLEIVKLLQVVGVIHARAGRHEWAVLEVARWPSHAGWQRLACVGSRTTHRIYIGRRFIWARWPVKHAGSRRSRGPHHLGWKQFIGFNVSGKYATSDHVMLHSHDIWLLSDNPPATGTYVSRPHGLVHCVHVAEGLWVHRPLIWRHAATRWTARMHPTTGTHVVGHATIGEVLQMDRGRAHFCVHSTLVGGGKTLQEVEARWTSGSVTNVWPSREVLNRVWRTWFHLDILKRKCKTVILFKLLRMKYLQTCK